MAGSPAQRRRTRPKATARRSLSGPSKVGRRWTRSSHTAFDSLWSTFAEQEAAVAPEARLEVAVEQVEGLVLPCPNPADQVDEPASQRHVGAIGGR